MDCIRVRRRSARSASQAGISMPVKERGPNRPIITQALPTHGNIPRRFVASATRLTAIRWAASRISQSCSRAISRTLR